eukprot:CAMPEP_0194257248 /NCGR_PEP_ID=MMETSP0158-20130606/38561_1 /TAXON_ID=33649 /ORGANISM="Thalassionema nitzschioides, Strain L26-B" /LENGTH=238 /DNA_ID=CAMNT_0038996223 /DNA_START=169 /DNA_END=882 /DNA_ORIENTATION=-
MTLDEDNRGGKNVVPCPSRSERKSIREKRRRNELNEALDSLACILRIINPEMECSYLSQNDLSHLPKKKMKSDTSVNITNRVDLINYATKVIKQIHDEKDSQSLGISDLAPPRVDNASLLASHAQQIDRYKSLRNSLGPLAAASILDGNMSAHGLPQSMLPFYSQSKLESISKMNALMHAGLPSVSVQARSHGMQTKDLFERKRQKFMPIIPTSAGTSILQTESDRLSSYEMAASRVL